ncbi:MAG: PVC-type heme-binding CxxCH protein, partial [Verrucomicrobiota bacterium]
MKSLPFLVLFLAGTVAAGEFPKVYNSEADTAATPPSAEAAVGMFDLPEGFTAQVYVAEPDVRNPIAMAWDRRGRMWVAENYTYAERATRFDLSLKDRVLIFEDTDWDGVADSRKVFTEDVQMLTSVELGRGGVWLMCPPQLLFIPDRDADDVPDSAPEVVLDGFTVAQSNYHNFANGLRWGPDGWLYGRCGHSCPGLVGVPGTPEEERIPIEGGIWRFHPERKAFEVLTHGTTNPWGHDWDRNGELFFINTVNGHLWHGIAGAHFTENFGADPNPWVYERIDTHADHYHYDRTGSWTKSRDGAANEFGGGHAHIGMMIYQGDSWPERFHDRLFTVNMHGRRTNVERLERVGTGFVGRHEPDIFLTGDEWFRGIDIRPGPDGSVYLIDWSDTGECHEHTGVHRTSGRIYQISYGETDKPTFPMAAHDWAFHENPWYWQSEWREENSIERTSLMATAKHADLAEDRLRAMWALYRDGVSPLFWRNFFKDPHESVRAWAVRLQLDQEPIDTILGPLESNLPEAQPKGALNHLIRLAREDESGLVRLALASGLQRLPLAQRAELGKALATRGEDTEDHNQPMMVWFGISPLAESDPAQLIEIARATEWPDLLRWISRSLSSQIEEKSDPVEALLSFAIETEMEKRAAILDGINEGLRGWRKAPKPSSWEAFVASSSGGDESFKQVVQELSLIFGDGRALDEIKAVAMDREADFPMRKAALETLIEARPDDLREICEPLLGDKVVNAVAVKGLVLFDDEELGRSIARQYRRFYAVERPSGMESLVSRPEWAVAMLEEMKKGSIPKTELSAFQARQISEFGREDLTALLVEVWGEARTSSGEKRQLISSWTEKLNEENLIAADLGKGRQLYAAVCASCHLLYGEGGKVGPDLTGSGRSELDYLLENILDPGAIVGADYQMSILTMKDGRLLTGVVAGLSALLSVGCVGCFGLYNSSSISS